MKQVFIHYEKWEDYQNGMWDLSDNEDEIISNAINFTSDHIKYGMAMKEVVLAWPNTMLNSLTNKSINQLAFVGHCACCYKFGWPEYLVRLAWKELTDEQRNLANMEAENAIIIWKKKYYESKNTELYNNLGVKMLF